MWFHFWTLTGFRNWKALLEHLSPPSYEHGAAPYTNPSLSPNVFHGEVATAWKIILQSNTTRQSDLFPQCPEHIPLKTSGSVWADISVQHLQRSQTALTAQAMKFLVILKRTSYLARSEAIISEINLKEPHQGTGIMSVEKWHERDEVLVLNVSSKKLM